MNLPLMRAPGGQPVFLAGDFSPKMSRGGTTGRKIRRAMIARNARDQSARIRSCRNQIERLVLKGSCQVREVYQGAARRKRLAHTISLFNISRAISAVPISVVPISVVQCLKSNCPGDQFRFGLTACA